MKHVLVVDNSSVVRKIARRIIEGMDMRVTEAEGCEQALEICARDLPDAIILDASLEGVKPLDFVREIRHAPGGETPRIIYCSAENDVIHLAGAMRSGANMFMMKPFNRAELMRRLQDLAA